MQGGSHRRTDEPDFNLKEWHLRARISRENTLSRRYSASYIQSFREDHSHSMRSNFTISSAASSPGYLLKDEIDPSTYSFTTALKALQARSGYVWEWMSPDQGLALNSKWDEAERYICNPLSGEVPMECLSAKTLTARSFRSYMAGRVTMSAPLVFSKRAHHHPSNNHNNNINNNHNNNVNIKITTTNTNSSSKNNNANTNNNNNNNNNKPAVSAATVSAVIKQQLFRAQFHPQEEEKQMGSRTRDVGIQSTPPPEQESSSSLSPASTPSIKERSIHHSLETEDGDAQNSSSSTNFKPVDECVMQVEVKITREEEETKRRSKEGGKKKNIKKKKTGQLCSCSKQASGCLFLSSLSWRSLWMKKRQREKLISPLPPNP